LAHIQPRGIDVPIASSSHGRAPQQLVGLVAHACEIVDARVAHDVAPLLVENVRTLCASRP
jgi:hypothetical protein